MLIDDECTSTVVLAAMFDISLASEDGVVEQVYDPDFLAIFS